MRILSACAVAPCTLLWQPLAEGALVGRGPRGGAAREVTPPRPPTTGTQIDRHLKGRFARRRERRDCQRHGLQHDRVPVEIVVMQLGGIHLRRQRPRPPGKHKRVLVEVVRQPHERAWVVGQVRGRDKPPPSRGSREAASKHLRSAQSCLDGMRASVQDYKGRVRLRGGVEDCCLKASSRTRPLAEREATIDPAAGIVAGGTAPLLAYTPEVEAAARQVQRPTDPSHLLAWMSSQRHSIDVRQNLPGSVHVHWARFAPLARRQVHQGLIHAPTRGVVPRTSAASPLVREQVVVQSTERRARVVAVDSREHMARPEDPGDCAILPEVRKGSAGTSVVVTEFNLGEPDRLVQHALQLLPRLNVGMLAPRRHRRVLVQAGAQQVQIALDRRVDAQADGVKVVRVLSQPGVPPLVGVAAGHRYQRGWKQFAHSLAHRQNGRHVCGGIGPARLVLWIMQTPGPISDLDAADRHARLSQKRHLVKLLGRTEREHIQHPHRPCPRRTRRG